MGDAKPVHMESSLRVLGSPGNGQLPCPPSTWAIVSCLSLGLLQAFGLHMG